MPVSSVRVIGEHLRFGFVQVKPATGMAEGNVVVRRIREFTVEGGPEPLCAVRIVVNEKAELLVREVALSDHRFENLLNHFCMNALMLRGM